ncbi:unnamed protein product [Alopecurus aequalis]
MAATATYLVLHHRDHNANSHRCLFPSSSLISASVFRSRGAKCSRRIVPRPSAVGAGDLEGNDISATFSAKAWGEEQTLKYSVGNSMLPSSTTRATSSMSGPVSLGSLCHHSNSQHSCFTTSKPNHDNPHKYNHSLKIPRRSLVLLPASSLLLSVSSSLAIDDANAPSTSTIDTTITDRIFMDFSICPSYFTSDRTLGAELSSCHDSEPLGRVVFGLYGRLLPITAANFKATCTASTYRGTLVHKLRQGQFFAAGRQGPRRDKGVVQPPSKLVSNAETVDPKAYQLRHSRPGTLSLCLGQNDDDDGIKFNPNYHNVEFLVTTGPGPCPELDGQNIVFGTVLEVTLFSRSGEREVAGLHCIA